MEGYGFDAGWAAEAARWGENIVGRVIAQYREIYRVAVEQGELLAEVSGRFRFDAAKDSQYPAVGDFVTLDRARGEGGNAVIGHVLTRRSAFVRKAAGTAGGEQVVAANIDTVFVCMACNNDFNLRRLERYLAIGWDSGAVPVVVLTKKDLSPDIDRKCASVREIAIGAEVLVTTAMETDGLGQIARFLAPGTTVALIGSSGVGKSTLINRLLGADRLATNGLRDDDKGRHTTTRRELLTLPNGAMVIDTPGMRELGMSDATEGLDRSFADIEALQCRFHDCTHTSEPGCAVRAAIENGTLSRERLESYQKLRQEADYARDRGAYLARKEKLFKEIARVNKARGKG